MATAKSHLNVPCFVCGQHRVARPTDSWCEVATMGPERRAHGSCFATVCLARRDRCWVEDDALATLKATEDLERARGVASPARSQALIDQLRDEHDAVGVAERRRLMGLARS